MLVPVVWHFSVTFVSLAYVFMELKLVPGPDRQLTPSPVIGYVVAIALEKKSAREYTVAEVDFIVGKVFCM